MINSESTLKAYPREPSIIQGAGMGLRMPHMPHILKHQPDVAWFELLADNWLNPSALQKEYLEAITERYPVVMHGVGLSLGGGDPLNIEYIQKIKHLKTETSAHWYSEHCSFSQHQGVYIPDLLPLPFTQEAVMHISERIGRVQDILGEAIVLENVSSYIECRYNQLSEAEFMAAIVAQSGCSILLDINNCYISAYNAHRSMGQDALDIDAYIDDYFSIIPVDRVRQIHLAGHEDRESFLLDTHGAKISDPVWHCYQRYIERYGVKPSMVEWDNDIPEFDVLHAEQQKINAVLMHQASVAHDARVRSASLSP